MATNEVGTEGMVLLRYLGGNTGMESWYGPGPRRTRYLFGGRRPVGYVDARDVDYLLGLRDNRRPVFELAEAAASPPRAPVFEPAVRDASAAALRVAVSDDPHQSPVETASEADSRDASEDEQPDALTVVDPTGLTIDQFRKVADGATPAQLARARAIEAEGKNRKGVLEAIDALLEAAHV